MKILKTFDITEYLTDFVLDNEMKNSDEILIELDGRKICVVKPQIDVEEVEFKITKKF